MKKNNPLISMTDLLFHFITIYYNLPNITRSLRVSIFHCLECFFSVCSSCFKIPYNVSFTHLQTFSTTLAMKSKIEHRGTILVKNLLKKDMSFKMFDIKAFLMWKKLVYIQLLKDFKVKPLQFSFGKNLFIFVTHFWKLQTHKKLSFFL